MCSRGVFNRAVLFLFSSINVSGVVSALPSFTYTLYLYWSVVYVIHKHIPYVHALSCEQCETLILSTFLLQLLHLLVDRLRVCMNGTQ